MKKKASKASARPNRLQAGRVRTGKTAVVRKIPAKKSKFVQVLISSRTYDEVPNEETIRSIRAAERYLKSGKGKWYSTVDEIMKALE